MDLESILPSATPLRLPPTPPRKLSPSPLVIASRKQTCQECVEHYGTGCWKDHEYGCTKRRTHAFNEAVQNGSCPAGRWADQAVFRPRGIITLAGGPIYTLNAYILCRLLREYGCTLPIEWFYLGQEMRPEWERFILEKVPDLDMINLGGVGAKDKHRGGWQAKTRALLETSFQEVMFLDADSHPLRDPTYLFDDPFFQEHGAVLWPDCWGLVDQNKPGTRGCREEWLKRFGVCPLQETESGQMLFDRRRCLSALQRAHIINTGPNPGGFLYGDKDTFALGFLQTETHFTWVPYPNRAFGRMMHPRDFQGRKILSHLVQGKWNPSLIPKVSLRNYPMLMLAQSIGREIAGLIDPNFTPAAIKRDLRLQQKMAALRRKRLLPAG